MLTALASRFARVVAAEAGQILVIGVLVIPLFIGAGAIVVDLGKWFEHRRVLQTKVDAAALAGGGTWSFPCTPGADATIVAEARKFMGAHTMANGAGPYVGSTLNPQVGGTPVDRLHANFNASGYWTDTSDPPDGTDVCNSLFLDVKVTEDDSEALFGIVSVDLRAKARVEIRDAEGVNDTLPFAVEQPKVTPCAWAWFVNDSTGSALTAPQALVHPGTDPLEWASPSPVNVNVPPATSPSGPGVSMRVRLGDCSDTRQQEDYDLGSNKGIVFGQVYSTASVAQSEAAKARSVTLAPSGVTGCQDAYFVRERTSCNVDISATVEFASGLQSPSVRAVPSGAGAIQLTRLSSTNTWVGGPIVVTPATSSASDPVDVALEWALGSGTWCPRANGCNASQLRQCVSPGGNPWAAANPCKGSLGNHQRVFRGSLDRSGPIIQARMIGGAPGNSFVGGSLQTLSAYVLLRKLEDALPTDPPVVIRASVQNSDNRSGALDCVQSSSNFRDEIINGCDGYVLNERNLVCSPDLTPPDCVLAEPGNKAGQLRQGMDQRFGCTKNYWRDFAAGQTNAIKGGDPRVAIIIVTNFGALVRGSGNPQKKVPIVAFAAFYVVGWDGDSSCSENDPYPGPGSEANAVWGHFVQFAAPFPGGIPDEDPCPITDDVGVCIATLVE